MSKTMLKRVKNIKQIHVGDFVVWTTDNPVDGELVRQADRDGFFVEMIDYQNGMIYGKDMQSTSGIRGMRKPVKAWRFTRPTTETCWMVRRV